jgi:hypothetical protein
MEEVVQPLSLYDIQQPETSDRHPRKQIFISTQPRQGSFDTVACAQERTIACWIVVALIYCYQGKPKAGRLAAALVAATPKRQRC